MAHTQPINAYMTYDEGEVSIRLVDAVIDIACHSWGVPLRLSLQRDGADLLIVLNAPNTASTPTSGDSPVAELSSTGEVSPSNQAEPVPPTSG